MIGYGPNGYRLWDEAARRIFTARDGRYWNKFVICRWNKSRTAQPSEVTIFYGLKGENECENDAVNDGEPDHARDPYEENDQDVERASNNEQNKIVDQGHSTPEVLPSQ